VKKIAFVSALALFVFAVVFELLRGLGVWPSVHMVRFRNVDLVAGFALAAVLVGAMVESVRRGRR
jgi:hypothetical protein